MKTSAAALIVLITLPIPITAQDVYKTTDEQGRIIYSDSPGQNSEKVDTELRNLHTPIETSSKPTESTQRASTTRYNPRLTSPSRDQQLGPTVHSVTIGVALNVALQDGHLIAFYLNGTQIAKSRRTSISYDIKRNMRGRNSASAAIIDQNGRTIETSAASTFYVVRPN